MKKFLIGLIIGSFFFGGITLAQTIPQLQQWTLQGVLLTPRNSSNGVNIPSLGAVGSPCIVVSATGTLSTATCGGSSGIPSTTPFSAGYIPYASGTPLGLTNSNIFQLGGNVGIGTTSPLATLQVNGQVAIGNTGINGFNPANSVLDIFAPDKFVYVDSNAGSEWGLKFRGVNPNFVDIFGFSGNGATGQIKLGSLYSSYYLSLMSGNAEAVRITTTGNVGIGTTNPLQKLEVQGNVSSTGLYINGVRPNLWNSTTSINGLSGAITGLNIFNTTTSINGLTGAITGLNLFNTSTTINGSAGAFTGVNLYNTTTSLYIAGFITATSTAFATPASLYNPGFITSTSTAFLTGASLYLPNFITATSTAFLTPSGLYNANFITATSTAIGGGSATSSWTRNDASAFVRLSTSTDTVGVGSSTAYGGKLDIYSTNANHIFLAGGTANAGIWTDGLNNLSLGSITTSTNVLNIDVNTGIISAPVSVSSSIHQAGTKGTASAPAYTFSYDKDDGIFQPVDDTLGFSTNGTQRLLLDSSGNASFSGSVTSTNVSSTNAYHQVVTSTQISFQDGTKQSTAYKELAFNVSNVSTTQNGVSSTVQKIFYTASNITLISCSTDGASVTLVADERSSSTPNTYGTQVFNNGGLVCSATGNSTTTFSNAGMAANAVLNFGVTAVPNATTSLRVNFRTKEQ